MQYTGKSLLLAATLIVTSAVSSYGTIVWRRTTLPTLNGAGGTNGDITWYSDPTVGNCFRVRVLDTTASTNAERAEFNMPQGTISRGNTYYFGWRSRFVMPATTSWNNVWQFHSHGTFTTDTPITMSAQSGLLKMMNYYPGGSKRVWARSLPSNVWFRFVAKIKFQNTTTGGTIQIVYNGTTQTLDNGTTTYTGRTWDGEKLNCHWGIYRSKSVNGTGYHYIKEPRVTTSYSEAMAPL